MPVRPTMADLLARLRAAIGDPAGAEAAWDDQALQDALDATRLLVWRAPLRPLRTVLPGGLVETRTYVADLGDWEAGCLLQDAAGATLAPAAQDLLAGRWDFASDQPPPVYLTGASYDLAAAAATVLEHWAARLAREFDFAADGQQFARSQQAAALRAAAQQCRARARPRIVPRGSA